MEFLGVFWYQSKTFIWKKYSKSKQIKYSGFVKLGVRWAERDKYFENLTIKFFKNIVSVSFCLSKYLYVYQFHENVLRYQG